jgi:hypothetical protein
MSRYNISSLRIHVQKIPNYYDLKLLFLQMNGDQGNSGSSDTPSWERPWSIDEMRSSAHDWSLASDAGVGWLEMYIRSQTL